MPNDSSVRVIEIVGVLFVLYLIIKYGVLAAMKARGPILPQPPSTHPRPHEGPGKFKVEGVDRATGMDTTWYCNADSQANAAAKGDLQGITVTRVTRA